MKKTALLLTLLLLCLSIITSCGNSASESSTSSQTSLDEKPLSKTEQLTAALEGLTVYTDDVFRALSMDPACLTAVAGEREITYSVDEFTMLGTSVITSPVKQSSTTFYTQTLSKTQGIYYAGEDEIKYTIWDDGTKQYLQLPDLYGETAFDYAQVDPSAATVRPSVSFEGMISEESITVSPDGKTFTVALGKDTCDLLAEKLKSLTASLNLGDLANMMGGLPGGENSAAESIAFDSCILTLAYPDDAGASLQAVMKNGDSTVLELSLNAGKADGKTTVALTAKRGEETVADFTFTQDSTTLTGEGNLNISNTQVKITLSSTKEGDSSTLNCTLKVTIDMSGMQITLPVTVSGTIRSEEGTTALDLSINAFYSSLLKFSIAMDVTMTPEDITLELPFSTDTLAIFDYEDCIARVAKVYYDGYFALFPPAAEGYLRFESEETLSALYLFADNTAKVTQIGTYTDTDSSITITLQNGRELNFPYTMQDDGSVTMFGKTMRVNEDDIYGHRYFSYYLKNSYDGDIYHGSVWIAMYKNGAAAITIAGPLDSTEPFSVILPDGNALAIDLTADGDNVILSGEILVPYE